MRHWAELYAAVASDTLPEVPLDSLVADSQGAMGYMIERALRAELRRRGHEGQVATIDIQVGQERPQVAPQHQIASHLCRVHGTLCVDVGRVGVPG